MEKSVTHSNDRWVLWSFIAFFSTIFVLDGIFVYIAVSTQTGVVVEHAYEKGLAYDEALEKARSQPQWKQKATYKDGVLRWTLADKDGSPIVDAVVTAEIIRSVQKGQDFDITLEYKRGGIYEAKPSAPLQGLWVAKLSGSWNSQNYQTIYEFIQK